MTIATLRTRIKTVLDTVSDKGLTHDYKRWAASWSDFLDLFKTTISSVDQIRGWEITYKGFSQTEPHIGRDADQVRVHSWRIDGYLGLNDSAATEKTLSDLAEDVCEALDADSTLNSQSLTLYREPTQLTMDHRLFGAVLCNHAEIVLQTVEVI